MAARAITAGTTVADIDMAIAHPAITTAAATALLTVITGHASSCRFRSSGSDSDMAAAAIATDNARVTAFL